MTSCNLVDQCSAGVTRHNIPTPRWSGMCIANYVMTTSQGRALQTSTTIRCSPTTTISSYNSPKSDTTYEPPTISLTTPACKHYSPVQTPVTTITQQFSPAGVSQQHSPVVDTQVDSPVVDTQVDSPVVDTQVDSPVVDTQVDSPVVDTQVDSPVVDTQVDSPVVDTQVDSPVVDTQVDSPVVDTQVDSPVQSVSKVPPVSPVVESSLVIATQQVSSALETRSSSPVSGDVSLDYSQPSTPEEDHVITRGFQEVCQVNTYTAELVSMVTT